MYEIHTIITVKILQERKNAMKISEMDEGKLKEFLGLKKSVIDLTLVEFDALDPSGKTDAHYEKDKRELIHALKEAAFVGTEDGSITDILNSLNDIADAAAIAGILIDNHTYSEIEININIPLWYVGIKGYVFASRLEFSHNLFGSHAEENDLLFFFNPIRAIRNKTGLSQENFAARYKIPRQTIADWERGAHSPQDYLIDLLLFRVEHDDFFG